MRHETQQTRDMVCPYCFHIHDDGWEIDGGGRIEEDYKCDNCEKTFELTV